jgi:hypothetical protein
MRRAPGRLCSSISCTAAAAALLPSSVKTPNTMSQRP